MFFDLVSHLSSRRSESSWRPEDGFATEGFIQNQQRFFASLRTTMRFPATICPLIADVPQVLMK
jgi:hypothetical protein